MIYRILADAVFVLHLGFILFVVLGGMLTWRWRWILWGHIPAALWGAIIEFAGWQCPLTPLENHLRRLGGEAGFENGFVEEYLVPLIYPGELSYGVQIALGAAVLILNVLVYWRTFSRPPRSG